MLLKLIVFAQLFSATTLFTQSCCSAGTPIVGSISLSPAENQTFSTSLTYNFNHLNDLFSGKRKLNENFRLRQTQAAIFEMSYGLSKKLSLNALFSFVSQERTLQNNTSENSFIRASGMGDGALILTYRLIKKNILRPSSLDAGVGIKTPLGRSDINLQGIRLPLDLQPGTGSWDYLLRMTYYYRLNPVYPIDLFSTASYRINGENDNLYKVGNEILWFAGLAYLFDDHVRFLFQGSYRFAAQDQQNDQIIEATGGHWIDLIAGLEVYPLDDLGIRFSYTQPMYKNLSGVQLTTTYSFSVTMLYHFNRRE